MPVGATVVVHVNVTAVVRRQIQFAVLVSDEAGKGHQVAAGTHSRVYINSEAFDAALAGKVGEVGVRVGLTGTSTHFVDERHTATREVFGEALERSLPCLTTSTLMCWVEEAAIAAVEEHIPPGSTTVGGETSLAHLAPTPKGMQVTCRAVLARVSPTRSGTLRLLFELTGEDRGGEVMRGTHTRFLVSRDAFEHKARGVLMPDGRRRGSWASPHPIVVAAPTLPSPPRPPLSLATAPAQIPPPPSAKPPAAPPEKPRGLPRLLAGLDTGFF